MSRSIAILSVNAVRRRRTRPLGPHVRGILWCIFVALAAPETCAGEGPGVRRLGKPPLFSFGVIADVQYCDCKPSGSRHYAESIHKLTDCVRDLNTRKLAFTIQLGDLIDRNYESFDRILPPFKKFAMPVYHVLGNHDFAGGSRRFARLLKRLRLNRRYYAFAVKGWRMIVLDGNDLTGRGTVSGSPKRRRANELLAQVKAAGRPNAKSYNGAIGAKQLAWLDQTLAAADKGDQRAIVFCHFPVYPVNVHNLWNDTDVIKILERHDSVAAYLNGHNHKGHYGKRSGIHYLTVEGMVETAKENAYAVVDVHADRLEVRGVGKVPSRTLRVVRKRAAARGAYRLGRR